MASAIRPGDRREQSWGDRSISGEQVLPAAKQKGLDDRRRPESKDASELQVGSGGGAMVGSESHLEPLGNPEPSRAENWPVQLPLAGRLLGVLPSDYLTQESPLEGRAAPSDNPNGLCSGVAGAQPDQRLLVGRAGKP